MQNPDTVIVSADQNPAFFQELLKCGTGEKGKAELRYTKKEQGADSAVLTVEAWVPEGYEVDESSSESAAPSVAPGDGVMTPTAMAVKQKSSK